MKKTCSPWDLLNAIFPVGILFVIELAVVIIPIVMYFANTKYHIVQFVLAIIGMLPLAKRVGDSVEQLVEHYVSRSVGGFLAATLGNAPELIFAIVAIFQNQVELTAAALFGSPMSNILLVLGTAIIAGTYFKNLESREFKNKSIHCTGTLLTLISTISYTIPTVVFALNNSSKGTTRSQIIGISEFVSVGNFLMYCAFTYYKFVQEMSKPSEKSSDESDKQSKSNLIPDVEGQLLTQEKVNEPEEKVNEPEEKWSLWYILMMMTTVTTVISLLSIVITDTIDSVLQGSPLSKTFVGIIILPFICNAAEHWTAITSMLSNDEDAADGAMEIAGGSALQVLGFVVPVVNFISFGASGYFTFQIDPLILITLNITSIIQLLVAMDNALNGFEGVGMVMLYIIIGAAFYIYDAQIA